MDAFNWNAHPALRCALALMLGIGATLVRPEATSGDAALRCALAIATAAAALLALGLVRLLPTRVAAIALVALVVTSGSVLVLESDASTVDPPDALDVRAVDCVGWVIEPQRRRGSTLELVIATDSIIARAFVAHVRARILVRLTSADRLVLAPRVGDRVSIAGRLRAPRKADVPGGYDERRVLASRSIALRLDGRASDVSPITERGFVPLTATIEAVREHLSRFADREVGGREGAIVEALLDGDRDGIDAGTRAAFAKTGTLHVLAVSGLHVAVIALGLAVVTSWMPGRRFRFIAFAVVLGSYALVAGANPSIVRAWCMAVSFALARLAGRRTRSLNVLAASAIAILVIDARALLDVGFQLSFAAVAGIILFNARLATTLEERLPALAGRRIVLALARALLLTLAAQLLTFPLLLAHFGSAPAVGLLLNLPVVPLTSCAMASAAIGAIAPPLAHALGATAYVAARLSLALVEWGATLPLASLNAAAIPASVALASLVLAVYASRAPRARTLLVRLVFAAAATAILAAVLAASCKGPRGAPRAYIVPLPRGMLIACAHSDTLSALVAGDTSGSSRLLADMVRFTGAATRVAARTRALGARVHARALAEAPMVVDGTASSLRLASFDGVPTLVIGARWRPRRALALMFTGRWESIAWP
jgi:competence protein ComEC